LLLVCDRLLLLENQKRRLYATLPLSSTQNLSTIDCGLAPNFWPLCTTLALGTTLQGRVLSYAHPTRPSWSVALPVVHADRVPCDTVRLQVEPPNVFRAREEVHRHFSLSICYVDRRNLGREEDECMRRKAQFQCAMRAGRSRRAPSAPDLETA
jgi:hypothetical protein